MNKYRFFILIIIGLLIFNGILFYMFIKAHSRKDGPKDIVIEKLHFDKEQIKSYEVYIQRHRKAIIDNEAVMNKLRSDLFEQLKYQRDVHNVDTLISKIAKQQYVVEKINFNHFLEIKRLCKPSQQKDFDALTNEISNLFSGTARK